MASSARGKVNWQWREYQSELFKTMLSKCRDSSMDVGVFVTLM